jgi:3D (Asp-Asp-Asp) domain-containing protein
MQAARVFFLLFCGLVAGCGEWGSGKNWVNQPMNEDESGRASSGTPPSSNPDPRRPQPRGARTIGEHGEREGAEHKVTDPTGGGGRAVGTFRNTYYDFPHESDPRYANTDAVSIMSASCQPIAKVPRGFHDAVCVQGSGALARGGTVSFAKRDCACAEVCPRTSQRICFDALDPHTFPFGRGASGKAILPLRSVAADTSVLAMGTVIYVPELDGAPKNASGDPHDGCFVVEDRGLRVKGEHVDIFSGHPSQTAMLERYVPSNQGVTVVVNAPKCASLATR